MPELRIDKLSNEVEKIIASPYPVALKNLHNIVSTWDNGSICNWADAHRAQIPALAMALLEGMQLWPYTLEIISAFSQARRFRDACLAQSPSILNELLRLASQSNEGFEQASKTCVSLLTYRLPATVALPSFAQDFVNRLFEVAIKDPGPETARPVYDVLSGACQEILELLPSASLTRFRENLFMLMKKDKKGDEQLLTLLSLSILGKIRDCCITPRPVRSGSTYSLTTSMSEEDRGEIDKYFAGEWAYKTMTLVFLQCIRVCGAEVDLDSASNRLRLAREIMHSVDAHSREEWVKKNPRYLQKLMQKATQANLDPLLKLENRVSQSFWHTLTLTSITSVCGYPSHTSNDSETLIMLNNDLKDLVTKSQAARSNISESLSANELTKPLDQFCAFEHQCAVTTDAIELEESLLSFLFNLDLQSRGSETRLPQGTLEQMLHKQRQLVLASRAATPQLSRPRVQTLQIEDELAEKRPSSHHWREMLISELDTRAKDTQTAVTRLLARTCEDLENRCHGIEEPLRRKEAERATLQHRHEVVSSELQQLREAYSEQESQMNLTRQDLSHFEQESKHASSIAEERQNTVKALEEQIKSLKRDRDQETSSLRSKYDQQDLELRTTIACQVEQINNQQNDLKALKQEFASQIEAAKETSERTQAREVELSESLASAQQSLASEEKAVTAKEQEIKLLKENGHDLSTKITALESEAERLTTRIHGLEEEATNAKDSHEHTLQSLRDLHEQEIQFLSEQAETAQANMKQHLAAIETELDQTRSEQADELRKKDSRIKELHDKLKRLSGELKDTSAQLHDAQALKNNLVSALGFNPENNQRGQSKELRGKITSDRTRPQNFDRDQPAQDLAEDADLPLGSEIEQDEDTQPPESSSSTSSASITGPTPKRARPSNAKPFKPPTREAHTRTQGPVELSDAHARVPDTSRMPLREARPRHLNRRSDSLLDRSKKPTRPSEQQQRSSKQTQLATTAGVTEQSSEGSDEENYNIDLEAEGWDTDNGKARSSVSKKGDFSYLQDLRTQDFDGTTVEL
ncbi:MAG: hypothetical protein M1831_002863 [Alyxoria varia]|nr:MAG: hypothetical protein M1831_002863 [Alyxoria varia]